MLKKIKLFYLFFCFAFLSLNLLFVKIALATEDPYYDLIVEKAEMSTEKPALNQNIRIVIKVKNNGTLSLNNYTGISNYVFSFDNFYQTSFSYDQISSYYTKKSGDYINFTIEGYFLKLSEANLNFTIDSTNQLEEKNEDNNIFSKKITVIEDKKDIEVTSIEFDPEKALILEEVKVIVTVKNKGETTLLSNLGFREEDFEIAYSGGILTKNFEHSDYPSKDNPLATGEEFEFTYYLKFNKEGKNSFSFAFDKNNQLNETNKNNNKLESLTNIYKTAESLYDFTISDIKLKYIDKKTVQIDWKTNLETNSSVIYKTKKNSVFTHESESSSSKKEHSVKLNNLNKDTEYVFKIKGINKSLEKFSKEYSLALLNDESIKISNDIKTEINNSDKKVNLVWKTNYLTKACVYYKLVNNTEYTKQCLSDFKDDYDFTIEKLQTGDYQFYINLDGSTSTLKSIKSEIKKFSLTTDKTETNKAEEKIVEKENKIEEKVEKTDESIKNKEKYEKLKGKILLKVEDAGKAYYINPNTQTRHYLGRPVDAFAVMRVQGIGITNKDLEKISIGVSKTTSQDQDTDGLSDSLEDAIGTDKNKKDTDNDNYSDLDEINRGYNPLNKEKLKIDNKFAKKQAGKILLQVEGSGEAWYINPTDNKRYFLGRPIDAFAVMRNFGLGISNNDFEKL